MTGVTVDRESSRTNGGGLVRKYVFAVGAVMLAFAARMALQPAVADHAPYVTFYVAVVLTALYAGTGPAALCAGSGGAVAAYFFVPPRFSFALVSVEHGIWLAFYFVTCATIIAAIDAQARAARAARQNSALAEARLKALQTQITMREQAEAERDRERLWASQTLASIGDAVLTTDTEGKITFINSVAASLCEWPPEEAVGQHVESVFHIVNERTGRVVESPTVRVLRDGVVVGLANHTVLVTRTGKHVPIDDSGAPIRDAQQNIIGSVLVFRDFTHRRRVEEEAARLASIVRTSQDAVISKTLDGTISTWNAGAERIFGFSAAEAIGQPLRIVVPPERQAEEDAMLEAVREGAAVDPFETVRLRKDGREIQVSVSASPIHGADGEVVGISHIARDITAQKEFERQLLNTQKLESLGVLAGGVAHDFNNLLTGIVGACSLATEYLPPDNPAMDLVAQAVAAGERAARLTQQLLAYSGQGQFLVRKVNASEAIRGSLALLGASVPSSVELKLELADSLPPVEVDVAQFEQVVMNLVINAAEAIGDEPGAVTVRTDEIRLEPREAPAEFRELRRGPYVRLQVRDTGCGMDASTVARIFEPFFTTKFTGRGLGLAAVQGIVRGHGGGIHVHTAPGKGSTFTVLLPAAPGAAAPAPAQERAELLHGGGTVLVIDDEEVVLGTARMALERYGYDVLVARNGQEGVRLFKQHQHRIAAVLLDLTMPVMGGVDALRRLLAIDANVPVVVCSGYDETHVSGRFAGLQVAGFLRKPFTAVTLVSKIKSVLMASK